MNSRPADGEQSADTDLKSVLASDRHRALRLLMFVRLAVSVGIMVFILIQFPNAGGLYWGVLSMVFGLAGIIQYALGHSRHDAPWQAYVFVALDLLLVTFIILFTNPFLAEPYSAVQLLRYPNFDFLYVVVAVLALGARPAVVAWSGTAAVLIWGTAIVMVASQPQVMTKYDISGYVDLPLAQRLELSYGANWVSVDAHVQKLFLMLLFALALAAQAWRARRLVGQQIQAERARTNLSRYFSPSMIEELAGQDAPLGAVREQSVAVLFADIVGFTALSEKRSPETVINLLREFHGRMARQVFAHDGTVDKYMGDAIMATFGTPRDGPRDATNALACARAMLRAVDSWNEERAGKGEQPISIGVGLHFGLAVMGDIGDERRLEYAVIGDTVNVASRLEALTREVPTSLVVSDATISAAKRERGDDLDGVLAGLVKGEAATVRGRSGAISVWTLEDKPA